jgi:SH3-like domain-containing protein
MNQLYHRILPVTLMAVVLMAAPALAKMSSVSVATGNVRSGPGTNHEVLWSVGKYYPVKVVKKSGGWCYISDFEGDTGWMHQSLLKDIPSVIVKATLVNVRENPGTKARVIFQAEKGVSLKRIEKKKDWLKVQHADGDVGWIHESLVWGY